MTAMTGSALTVEDLQRLAKSPKDTHERISDVLLSLGSADEEVRAWASDCLSQLESLTRDGANTVKQYCEHDSAPVASWACKLLAKCESPDPQWESCICQALDHHESIAVRAEAAGALGRLENLNAQTKQSLAKAAVSENPRLSRLASRALER